LIIILASCQYDNKDLSSDSVKEDSEPRPEKDTKQDSIYPYKEIDTLVIHENSISGIALPFERKEMITKLKDAFDGLNVKKEIGQQDGPDFMLYSLKNGNERMCFFAMDGNDSLSLTDVYINSPLIKDQYGLKVGDGYQEIKRLRNEKIEQYTGLHQHTYITIGRSNIMYEIIGYVSIPDTADMNNLHFTEEQIKDWKIEYIIWRERNRSTTQS